MYDGSILSFSPVTQGLGTELSAAADESATRDDLYMSLVCSGGQSLNWTVLHGKLYNPKQAHDINFFNLFPVE